MTSTATIQLNADSRQVIDAAHDLDKMADAAATAELASKKLEAGVKKLSAAELKLTSTSNKLKGVTGRLASETNKAKRAELLLKKATLESSAAQQAASISAQKLAISQAKVGTGAVKAGKGMGMMKSRVQQVGFQVQDFVVQLQGGTSAFVAFGQQGSQLAGAFGPGGAILGAFIALGSVIGGVMAAQMANAGNAVDDLIDKLRDGTQEMDKLGEAQKKVFRREQLILISETTDKLKSYDEKIADTEATLGRFQAATSGWGVSQVLLDRNIKQTIDTLDDLKAGRESENELLKTQTALLNNVALGVSKETKEIEARNRARSQSAFERVGRVGASPAQQAANEFADRKKIIDAEAVFREAGDAEVAEVRKANAQQLADDLLLIEKNRIDATSKLRAASDRGAVSAAGQIAGNLAAISKEGGKDSFENYKLFASAQAGISAALGIMGVIADPLIPTLMKPALIGTIGALGAVQVAQIQGQEYQPRALGGQMKAGGSFLVGERGPELVTMGNKNANIQAAGSFGGEQAVQVTNVYQISTGVQATVQAEIMRIAPVIAQMSVQAVNRAARKGGATSKVMGRR